MDKTIRNIAIRLSAMLFFVMALIGWLSGLEPMVCTQRALIGAAALYLTVCIAGNLIVRILVDAMAQDRARRRHRKNQQT
ncbi:MAG TPA: hypothetical protein ENN97_10230 [Phycisphaerales bacterium]|nr:hypothetical protein [Phycisphaerales bacterium]